MSPKILARLTVALVLGALVAIVPAAMASPGDNKIGTLTINGVTGGGAYNAGPSDGGVIDVYGYSLSIKRPPNTDTGGPRGAKARPSELSIVKRADRATPRLYTDIADGRTYSSAILRLTGGDGSTPYLTYCFAPVQLLLDRLYNDGDRADVGSLNEALTLNYGKISITFSGPFQTQDLNSGWDFSKNTQTSGGCPSGKNYNT
jgi:type VI protein secretion system component Hcp